ncbi:MAG: ABC transporter permease, partial [Bacteroidales bacterium]
MTKLKIILRSILMQKLNSGIIIISLSVGLACFNLIMLFISRELKTDSFYANHDRIFALNCDDPWGKKMYYCRFGSAEYLKKNYPAVEDFCRFNNAGAQKLIVNNEEYYDTPLIIGASPNFFSFFSYNLLTNNPATALASVNNIVLSEDLAKKYFGTTEPVGKIIKLVIRGKEEEFEVTGVFQQPRENTQIKFDMVRPIGETDSRCYVRLSSKTDKAVIEKIMADNRESIPIVNTGTPGRYYLEPMQSAYFNPARASYIESSRDKTDLWIALIIGLMIIGIASFNYMGLLNNRLIEKNKEFTVRRINGSSKYMLIIDFLTENLIIIGISLMFSIFLMQEMLPFFNEVTKGTIPENFIFERVQIITLIAPVLFLLLLAFAFVFFKIRSGMDINALKSGNNLTVRQVQFPAFNIFQLSGSIGLVICSIVIIKQIGYIAGKPIGLDKNVIEVKLPGQYAGKVSAFREELTQNACIRSVSVVTASPVLEHLLVLLEYEQEGVKKQYSPAGFSGDENYLSTMGIELIEGEGFTGNPETNKNKCLINLTFAKLFVNQNLIGKGLPGMEKMIVCGIVKDFNYSGLKTLIEPAFISFAGNGSHLMVKASTDQYAGARDAIAATWKNLIPDYPLNIESVGDRFEWFHKDNINYIRLIGACAFISLFLSFIGLFSVSYQSSRQRNKEVGIRKINGAGILEILEMLNRDFVKWVVISFIIACPIAWYAMHKWLQNYAYKTDFSWWIFPLAGILTLGIAILTISLQSWRVATRNPVETLRYE